MAQPLSRSAIIATARELIVADGLDGVSLRRIATALGVTAPALYAYGSDKRDLLGAIAEEEFAVLLERFHAVDDEVRGEPDDPVERTRGYLAAYVRHARSRPELFKTMFLFPPDIGLQVPEGAELPAATEAISGPADAIADAIASGAFRPVDPLTATLVLWSTAHGLAEILLMGFELDEAYIDELIGAAVDIAVRGLLA